MSSSVIDAFKRLNMSTAQDTADHETVFEVSYQYLSKVKDFNDINAFHNCLVALINLDRYYRALQLVDEASEEVHREFPVEKAYVYYKTGHFDRLKSLYEESEFTEESISQRALKHVMAQSYYQNGHVSEALELYRQLISSNSVDNELDMACNERAILAQLAAKQSAAQNPVSGVSAAEITYDIVFNEALMELGAGNVSSSMSLLEKASAMCLEQNMDSDPADLALEIAPIKLTVAYIHHILGRPRQALAELELLDLAQVTDLMTRLTFKNNYIALKGTPENVNFAARELNYKDNMHLLRHKLTKPQFRVLVRNHLLLSYKSGTLSKTSNFFKPQFELQFSTDFHGDLTPSLYKALVGAGISFRELQSEHDAQKVSRQLYKYCLRMKSWSGLKFVAAALLLVHVNSRRGKFDQALEILEKYVSITLERTDIHVNASLVGTLINIYETMQGDASTKKLTQLLQSLIVKFESYSVETLAANADLYQLVRAFAFKISGSSLQDPSKLFKLLKEANPTDALIASALTSENSGLVPAEELASPEDVEDLLAVNIEDIIKQRPTASVKPSTRAPAQPFKVTKKAHKPKFSKNKVLRPASEFNAENLDKERWLPMKLRSYYKPSKKDMKKKSGGHQGAVEQSPAPSPAQTSANASSSKSKSKNKKKKKGKK